MTYTKRTVWNLCQHDPDLAAVVTAFGQSEGLTPADDPMRAGVVGLEVEANGQAVVWGQTPDGRANWERYRAENGDPRDQPGWMRGVREAGL